MKTRPSKGEAATYRMAVNSSRTISLGRGGLSAEVCSTPSMILAMELAAKKLLLPHLEENEESVGVSVELRRNWAQAGRKLSYSEILELVENAPARRAFIDPDAPELATPGNMPARITESCRRNGQPEPADPGYRLRKGNHRTLLPGKILHTPQYNGMGGRRRPLSRTHFQISRLLMSVGTASGSQG
jgi:hypothetical protein